MSHHWRYVFCCHHNSSRNSNEHVCLCNKCMCIFGQLSKIPRLCKYITILDIRRSLVDGEFARSISQHQVASALNELPLADFVRAVAGMTPPENLHAFYLGLYIQLARIVHDLMGKANKNAKWKDLIDQLHQRISLDLRRQSDRDFHRCSIRFGWLDLTRVTGTERAANLYVFLILLHTKQGEDIMSR